MSGTCLECHPERIFGEDEPVIYTFFAEIAQNERIIDLANGIQVGDEEENEDEDEDDS